MRSAKLLGASLITLAALGAMSAAAAKAVLVLKEEGKPVAAGAELGVELETGGCKLTERAHLSLNGAKKDKIAVERAGHVWCYFGEIYSNELRGGVTRVKFAASSSAILIGAPLLKAYTKGGIGPQYFCVYEVRKFFGTFPVPGHAVIEGSAPGKFSRRDSSEDQPGACASVDEPSFRITVTGHNNKPLETELMTHH